MAINIPSGPLENDNLGLHWKTARLSNGRYQATSRAFPQLKAEGSTPGLAVQNGEAAARAEYLKNGLTTKKR